MFPLYEQFKAASASAESGEKEEKAVESLRSERASSTVGTTEAENRMPRKKRAKLLARRAYLPERLGGGKKKEPDVSQARTAPSFRALLSRKKENRFLSQKMERREATPVYGLFPTQQLAEGEGEKKKEWRTKTTLTLLFYVWSGLEEGRGPAGNFLINHLWEEGGGGGRDNATAFIRYKSPTIGI